MALTEVVRRVSPMELSGDAAGVCVSDVQFDHRLVRSGDLFCCVPGEHSDGHDYAAAALGAGAVAFICERQLGAAAGRAPQLIVAESGARPAMAEAACAVSGDPASKLDTVGVTGTNGKTTTTYLLKSILDTASRPTSVVGTLVGSRTTPEAPDLQRRFAAAVADGLRAVALEVTSHALVQHRVDGYVHDVAVFTNLSQDHLDYHLTMERYFEAKALLFTESHARLGVANADDPYGERLLATAAIPVAPFRLSDAAGLAVSFSGARFVLDGHPVGLRLTGEPNVRNALAAAAAARALGVPSDLIAEGLSRAVGVPGRFEPVPNSLGISAVVDYAHTPAALGEALAAVRVLAEGKLIVVFGAGGDRDREKRPLMGSQATRRADIVIVTSDNPRHESPDAIIGEIVAGCDGPAQLLVEPDRRRAIRRALELAREHDLVVIAGKGHEKTQQVGDDLFGFDDREVLRDEAQILASGR